MTGRWQPVEEYAVNQDNFRGNLSVNWQDLPCWKLLTLEDWLIFPIVQKMVKAVFTQNFDFVTWGYQKKTFLTLIRPVIWGVCGYFVGRALHFWIITWYCAKTNHKTKVSFGERLLHKKQEIVFPPGGKELPVN